MNTFSPYVDKILKLVSDSNTHLNAEAMDFMNELGFNLIHYFMENLDKMGMRFLIIKLISGDLVDYAIENLEKKIKKGKRC